MPSAQQPRQIDPSDVTIHVWSSHGPGSVRRSGIRMRHIPTGVSVEGDLPTASHTDEEEHRLREGLRQRLWSELEAKVAGSGD